MNTTPDWLASQREDLARLARRSRLRALAPRRGVDFASNDYLGLAEAPVLREAAQKALARGVPVGSGGSRLLRGNHEEHEALEAEAAAFFGAEAALFLPTGFTGNSALLATLPQHGDRIFADRLIHASMHEGLRLTRAGHELFAHNDVEALDAAVRRWRAGGPRGMAWIAVESLYSMDGDFAPLERIADVAAIHGAMLLVDEAHATGVFGPGGRGCVADLGERAGGKGRPRAGNIVTLHTLGKALGCEGALLCGPEVMREYLVNRARGFIFSTAPSPLSAAIAREALRIVEAGDDLRAELMRRLAVARDLLGPLGAQCHGSPILPLVLGGDARSMAVAARAQAAGFDVRGIRPPTVPPGTSRLRIVITRNVGEAEIAALADALSNALSSAWGDAPGGGEG